MSDNHEVLFVSAKQQLLSKQAPYSEIQVGGNRHLEIR
jgi:hypothetical protein